MTISRLQAIGQTFGSVTNYTRAFASDVAAGSLIVISSARWRSGDATAYVAGNCTKSAGTATIDTPVLEYTASPGTSHRVGVWSMLVTGGGSLTLQITNPGTGCSGSVAMAEFAGSWGASRVEDTSTGSGSSTAADSGNATSAGAAVFVGSVCTNSGVISTLTEDAAFELIAEDTSGSARIVHGCIDRIVSSGTTDSASWTISNAAWVAGVIVFKEGVNVDVALTGVGGTASRGTMSPAIAVEL